MQQLAQVTRDFRPGGPTPEVVDPGKAEGGVATIKGMEAIFSNLVTVFIAVAGIGLFTMLIVGGFKYLTAGDNADQAKAAQQTLTYALFGFILIISSLLIMRLIEQFTGIPVTLFKVTHDR